LDVGNCCANLVAAVTDDERDVRGVERARGIEREERHRFAGDWMQNFGQGRFHPRALARGENYGG
jgi:hypothetical protein